MAKMSEAAINSASEEAVLQARGYKLLRKLGEGSYAQVFLAELRSEKLGGGAGGANLACKVVDAAKASDDFAEKFLPRELGILARLNHPHIIHVHSIFQRRRKYFIFMRLAENGDLLEFVVKNGPVAESQARVWLRQLALGLQYLHEMDVAHRDIKCENILISGNYNVKLADFGFARSTVDARGKNVLSDTYCGSLSYAAPELLRGSPYSPKIADIWSLGVVLYILVNGRMPFDDPNVRKLRQLQIARKWKFRSKIAEKLSENVKKLTTNMLEPEVAKRPKIEQIVKSDWIAMDPRLLVLSSTEQTALDSALRERTRRRALVLSLDPDDPSIKSTPARGTSGNGEDEETEHKEKQPILALPQDITVIKDPVKGTKSVLIGTGNYYRNLDTAV